MIGIGESIFLATFGLSIAAITFARRYKCPSSDAGVYIAGWGFIVLCILAISIVANGGC
jgi:hypothetical protein